MTHANPHADTVRGPRVSPGSSRSTQLACGTGRWLAGLRYRILAAAGLRSLDPNTERSIDRGLQWVARTQSRLGHWTAQSYPTAMTALAGTALLCSGSTTTQGPFAPQIRRAVDYLMTKAGTTA